MMTGKELTFVFLQLALSFLIKFASSEDVLLNLNPKKVVALTSDKFLSFTLDPALLLTGNVLTSSTELSTNMAKALAPGYVRLTGPRSNTYSFERTLFPETTGYEDPDLTFSEAHWVLFQQWAQRAGLDVVASLAPQRTENEDQATTWDPRNSLDLISFSDHMGYNISWQLGYECQTRCDITGYDLGKDIARLKNILTAFPRYSNSIIAGPDVVSFRGKQQQQYLQDYLNAAGSALSVITWHPDFAGIALDSDGVALQIDTLASDKDLLYKAMGRSLAKKPLWIAESKPEECKRQFLGALVWARRLGSAAKLGVQVIMRQPDASNIFQPSPDYWVSVLHKMLVGREVLDSKLTSSNKTHVHFYCQCTKPSAKYDRGAITIFGINLMPSKVSVSLKGLKIKAIHKYILMPGYDTDNRMFAETVLLNNEPLNLINGKTLPEINPSVTLMGKNMAVKLPSGGIGFWVIPGARVKSCLGHDDEAGDKNLLLKKLTKKLEEPEVEDENLGHEVEDDHHQELEGESETEDIKSFLKSKKKKRKYRYSDETDDEDRRFKRIDTKKELEKLEKLLKRNNNNEDKKISHLKSRMGLTMFESGANDSGDNKDEDTSAEDAGLVHFKNEKIDSGEEIRTKLEEYKNKLLQYQAKKQNHEKSDDQRFEKTPKFYSKTNLQPDEHLSNTVDTQKAMDALALISKVEGVIREYGEPSENIKYENDSRNGKPDLESDIGEEMLIEELEKSDKIKRMIDPKSLDKFYHFFMNNGKDKMQKRSVENNRNKRDLEKLLGDDPLGLRKEGLFKKRFKNDEAKERRFERRNRKKDKDDIGIKKELSVARYDPRTIDSNENNFFGFPQMKPVENFPDGDLFLKEGSSSEEKSHDYDYVKDDDDDDDDVATVKKQKRNKRGRTKSKKQNKTEQIDETWVEEPNSNLHYAPNEFFEKLNLPTVAIKTQWKDYSELYEPESLQQQDIKDEQKTHETDTVADTVIVKDQTDEREDKRAKETAVKKLINYYDNSEVLRTEPEFTYEKPRLTAKKHKPKLRPEPQTEMNTKEAPKNKPEENVPEENTKRVLELDNNYDDNDDLGSLEFMNSKAAEDYSEESLEDAEIGVKKRPKRRIPNLDNDVFRQEMIREDAGNLRDCKCRVIRSTGKVVCKNCKKNRRRQRDIAAITTLEEAVTDPVSTPYPSTTTDQSSIVNEPKTEEFPLNTSEVPEPSQRTSAPTDIVYSNEALLGTTDHVSSSNDAKSLQKNAEVADLVGDTHESTVSEVSIDDTMISSETRNKDNVIPESSSALTEEENSQISNITEANESASDFYAGLPGISGNTVQETEKEKSSDDVVASQRLYADETSHENPEILNLDEKTLAETGKDLKQDKGIVDIEKNISIEDIGEDNHAKRHIPETPGDDSDSKHITKMSLSTGVNENSFSKTELSEGKLKKTSDQKFKSEVKSSGLQTESGKSKLALNTEALSALIKESENKKTEVLDALKSSAKLKSVDNTKYLEYQKKRADKLVTLKEKLRERKAKILQQYRQELLDALSKCDDEVERNLKRREIWDDLSQQREFQEFVDKDKLAYLMMHRPVNYEDIEKEDSRVQASEDRRYYPEIELVQPLHNAREPKISITEPRKYFYWPKATRYASSSQESSFELGDSIDGDQLSEENIEPMSKSRYNDDESYYAIVESLENPKILQKKHFEDMQASSRKEDHDYNRYYDADSNEIESADARSRQQEQFPRKNNDRQANKQFYRQNREDSRVQRLGYEPDPRFARIYDEEKYVDRQHGQKSAHRVFAIDSSTYNDGEPVLHGYDKDLGPVYEEESNYYDEYPETYHQESRRIENMRYRQIDDDPWDSLIPEYHDRILHHKRYPKPIDSRIPEKSLRTEKIEINQRSYNPEELTTPKRFAFDTRVKKSPDEFYGHDVADIPLKDGIKILKKLEPICSDGNCGTRNSFGNTDELEESENYYQGPMEDQPSSEGLHLIRRSERHLVPRDTQVLEENAYKIVPVSPKHELSVRKQREVEEKRSNYICLKEDSGEDFGEDEKRLFTLVNNGDHYEAVPFSVAPEETGSGREKKSHRRVAKHGEKIRTKRRKYSTDVYTDENGNYYVRNDGYVRRNSPKRQLSENRQLMSQNNGDNDEGNFADNYKNEVRGKSHLNKKEIDYNPIGDEINRLESDQILSPEEYELLMLIPVKKHKVKRQKRDLDNNIDRSESYEDMNEVWGDIVDLKENENRLQDYIDAKKKTVRDFEEAQANLNKYLTKLESMHDPMQVEKFESVILNLGSTDQEKMGAIANTQDEIDRIHLGEYLKQEILKKLHSSPVNESEKSTSDPGSSIPPTLFEAAIPKLESTINEELEKAGDLTESLEDFVNEFDEKFNKTLEIKSHETTSETPARNEKISYNIFHTALNNVRKFFEFLAGVTSIFRRH